MLEAVSCTGHWAGMAEVVPGIRCFDFECFLYLAVRTHHAAARATRPAGVRQGHQQCARHARQKPHQLQGMKSFAGSGTEVGGGQLWGGGGKTLPC